MTPETPDPPPVSPDPWDSVHEEFADMSQWETARVYRADAVDAARAADAALLRERDAQIASLTAERDQMAAIIRDTLWMAARYADGRRSYAVGLYNDARVKAEALGCAHEAWPAVDGMDPERPTLTEELATLRAERDAAQQEIAEQQRDYAILSKMMARETEMLRDEEQENTTLRETLQAAWCELIQHDDQPWVKTLAGQVRVVGLFAFPRPQESQP